MLFAQIALLEMMDNFLWGYIVLPVLLVLGIYLTYESRFVQFRRLPHIFRAFFTSITTPHRGSGVHPLKAFFTCIGGCMGISNVVAVCTAVQIGGPGALLWIWVTAIAAMVLKYSEVYLGIRYRVVNDKGEYRGGPMYFLQPVYQHGWILSLVGVLLCLYGVEIYQFNIITEIVSTNLHVDKLFAAIVLIILMIAISRKGIHQVGRIASVCVPCFIICYLAMGIWVFVQNIQVLPSIFRVIVESAFTGHAAVGAFAGSSILLTASQGMRRSCYSGDVALGYASVIHSETGESCPKQQASLAILEVFLDSFVICTTSIMLILVTGVWTTPVDVSVLVQHALSGYFSGMHVFMPLFLLLIGFTTIISYFCAGIKCAEFLCPKIGRRVYYVYAFCSLVGFVFVPAAQTLTVMSITAGMLLMLNLYGIFCLRREIEFHTPEKYDLVSPVQIILETAVGNDNLTQSCDP